MDNGLDHGTAATGIVIIGRNEGERLVRSLSSMRSYKDKAIYVDSGSSDDSVATARRLGFRALELDASAPFSAARARNEGVRQLINLRFPDMKFIQFVDGDCELAEGWIPEAEQFLLQHPQVAAVCGRRREREPGATVYNLLSDLEWNTPIGEARSVGGDAMFRLETFNEVGGFLSELIAGEEPELCSRLRDRGWTIWRLDADMTRHDVGMTRFAQWWQRAVRGGFGCLQGYLLHISARHPPWRRELFRSVIWSLALPIILLAGAMFHPAFFAGLLLYPFQVIRIAWSRGITRRESWIYALFTTFAKFAEFEGILKCGYRHLTKKQIRLIEYK